MRTLSRSVFRMFLLFAAGIGIIPCQAEYIPFGGWPSLVIVDNPSNGSLARLDYSHEKGRYFVAEGRFTMLVAGNERIERKPETGSYALAKPTSIAFLKDSVYGIIPSYNALVQLSPRFDVASQGAFGPYTCAGSMEMSLGATEKALCFFHRGSLLTFDQSLNKLAEVQVKNVQGSAETFIIAENKVYVFQVEELGPMSRGGRREAGPSADSISTPRAGPGCVVNPDSLARPVQGTILPEALSNDLLLIIDLSDPAKPVVVRNEVIPDPNPPSQMRFQALNPQHGRWLIVDGHGASCTVQLRGMERMASITLQIAAPGEIVGMTELPPFYAIIRQGAALKLLSVMVEKDSLTFGTGLDLGLNCSDDLSWERPLLKQNGSCLFVIFRNQLRVVDTTGEPSVILSQPIAPDLGAQCRISQFIFVGGQIPPRLKADPQLLETLLGLSYYGPEQNLQLQTELDKLTAADAWAIKLLAETLGKDGQPTLLRPRLIKTLGDLGVAAQPTIGAILDTTCNGYTIFGELPPIAEALARIDPSGDILIPELAAFEKRKGESSAQHVSKAILAGHPSPAAERALKKYQ